MLIDMETIGERLKQLRGGLTQPEMARIAGTSKQYVSQLESGRNQTPNPIYLDAWARHFGVAFQWLLTGKGPKAAPALGSQSARWTAEILGDAMTLLDEFDRIAGFKPSPRPDPNRLVIACEVVSEGEIAAGESVVVRLADRLRKWEADHGVEQRTAAGTRG